MTDLLIRAACFEDWPTIVEFNQLLAAETEGKQLEFEKIRHGVQELLKDPSKGRYFVACTDQGIVGQMMHTWEWSDWRNGQIWWLQSVYVREDYRRAGVFRQIYEHVQNLAQADDNVVGLRLYVEGDNTRAHATYERMGLAPAGYFVMERFFTNEPSA